MASRTKPTRVKITGDLYHPVVPDGAVRITRPGRWGNPHKVGPGCPPDIAAARFRADLFAGRLRVTVDDVHRELAGHDLACWCPLDRPCHGDVLLEVANWTRAGAGSRDQGGPNDNSG